LMSRTWSNGYDYSAWSGYPSFAGWLAIEETRVVLERGVKSLRRLHG
jgi:hypothetical protein